MFRKNIGDIILSFAVFFQIAVLMLKELLVAGQIVEHESFRMISILLAALPLVPAIYYIIKRRLVLSIGIYLLVIFIVLSTLVFFTDNEQYLFSEPFNESGAFYLLFINIPSFLCLASIRDIFNLKRIMLLISYVIFALGILYLYFLWIGRISYMEYSITFSYYLLLPALVFLSQRKMLFMFLFIIICIMMLMLGSRGALVAGFFYAILLLFIDRESRGLILSSAFLIVLVFGSLLTLFLTYTSKIGVSSRTVTMFLEGNAAELSGRDWLYSTTWNSILESPFLGHGIFGDRVILDGDYCHNILLEIFHNFGFLFGAGLILLISIATIRVYLNSNSENRKLLLMFFCYSIIPLMASTSYLQDPKFGIFIGSLFVLKKNTSID
ncbi:MAG: O-antigen ligase family protein [Candidatus Kariarchaeaceae archaeon]|jgi:O-antigen ligase